MSRARTLLLFTTLTLLFSLGYYLLIAQHNQFIRYENGVLHISDFAYYVVMTRGFWFNGFRQIYEVDTHLTTLRTLLDAQVSEAMPLGSTPLALFIYLPSALIYPLGIQITQSLWVGLSLAALAMTVALYRDIWIAAPKLTRLRALTAVAVVATSHSLYFAATLGQTSILALAAFGIILDQALNRAAPNHTATTDRQRDPGEILSLIALLYLGIKPTYFGLALLLLASLGRWRLMLKGCLGVSLLLLLFSAVEDRSWLSSYLHTFANFGGSGIQSEYRAAFAFDYMNILRSAFVGLADEILLVRLSKVLFALSAFLALALLLAKGRSTKFSELTSRSPLLPFLVVLFSYLLFAPYLSSYEDLLLAVPLFLLPTFRLTGPKGSVYFAALLVSLLVSLNFLALQPFVIAPLLWCTKVAYVAMVVWLFTQRSAS